MEVAVVAVAALALLALSYLNIKKQNLLFL
jgi:hypothetical protein